MLDEYFRTMSYNNTNTDILLVRSFSAFARRPFPNDRLTYQQAGAFAAFTVDILVYPLDTIKTRFQSPDYKRLYTNPSNNAINRSLFRGLYQGIGSVVLATIPSC